MTVRRLAHGVAASLATVVLLGGCSDDPEPRFSEPTDSSTPSGSATTPADPEQTAEEFIREWFRAGTEMQNSGDTAEFRQLSGDCEPCNDFAARVEDIYSAGGLVRIRTEKVARISPIASSKGTKQYAVIVDASPTRYRESAKAKTEHLPGGRNEYRVTLTRQEGGWVLQNYLDTPE